MELYTYEVTFGNKSSSRIMFHLLSTTDEIEKCTDTETHRLPLSKIAHILTIYANHPELKNCKRETSFFLIDRRCLNRSPYSCIM